MRKGPGQRRSPSTPEGRGTPVPPAPSGAGTPEGQTRLGGARRHAPAFWAVAARGVVALVFVFGGLFGLAGVASASTAVSSVAFTGSSQVAGATGTTWTVAFTSSASGSLATGWHSHGQLPGRLHHPGHAHASALATGFSSCTATGSTTGTVVTVTLAGASCALASATAATVTIAGITNTSTRGGYPNGYSVKTSADTTAVTATAPISGGAGIPGSWSSPLSPAPRPPTAPPWPPSRW